MDELTKKASPYVELSKKVDQTNVLLNRVLDVIEGDEEAGKESLKSLLQDIRHTLKCFKHEHRDHRTWGKKVAIFTLFTSISMAVIALGVEVATKGQMPAFTIVYDFLKGLW